ncbi:hypothetical protein SEVIR_2G276850v4 [Setaria viridis]
MSSCLSGSVQVYLSRVKRAACRDGLIRAGVGRKRKKGKRKGRKTWHSCRDPSPVSHPNLSLSLSHKATSTTIIAVHLTQQQLVQLRRVVLLTHPHSPPPLRCAPPPSPMDGWMAGWGTIKANRSRLSPAQWEEAIQLPIHDLGSHTRLAVLPFLPSPRPPSVQCMWFHAHSRPHRRSSCSAAASYSPRRSCWRHAFLITVTPRAREEEKGSTTALN